MADDFRKMDKEEPVAWLRKASSDNKQVAAWNGYRRANPDWSPELEHAELGGTNLVKADLHAAGLQNANFSHAYLEETNLDESKSQAANFTAVNLYGAYLNDASLFNAILKGATLGATDLRRARLELATLSEAYLAPRQACGGRLLAGDGRRQISQTAKNRQSSAVILSMSSE